MTTADSFPDVSAFLAARCLADGKSRESAKALMAAYSEWADEQWATSRKVIRTSYVALGAGLVKNGFPKFLSSGRAVYFGLRLKTPEDR